MRSGVGCGGVKARRIDKAYPLVYSAAYGWGYPSMPTKAPIHGSKTKSEQHRAYDRQRASNPALAAAARIRSSARWQALRDWYRHSYPLCFDPFGDHNRERRTVAADQVHHIEPLAKRPDLAFDPENLAGLCCGCHRRIEQMTRTGKPTAELFKARKHQNKGEGQPGWRNRGGGGSNRYNF
jgi:5-methylcytosine-specific restriction endonuclease McrA